MSRTVLAALLACVATLLAGCGSYTLRGRVVVGGMSTMTFVEDGDARLAAPAVSAAEIVVYRDPDKPNRTRVGRAVSGPDGAFALPVGSFGAGFLVEEFEIVVRRTGSTPARLTTPLPDETLRLLIMLAPGAGTVPEEQEDLMETYRRYR